MLSHHIRHRDLALSAQRSSRWASGLWAVGVVSFLLSVASPYDDAFQQELFRPKSFHVAVRRLPSVPTGTRKSGAPAQLSVAAVANASVGAIAFRDVESGAATLLVIRSRSHLALRSPPPVSG